MLNILIISDEAKNIAALFKAAGFSSDTQNPSKPNSASETASSGAEGYDIAFLDLDTENWQQRLLDVRHTMPVIAFAQPDLKRAIEAMKLGASDFLEKPLTGEALNLSIERHKKQILNHKYGFDEIIGMSRPMQDVFGLIKKAAASESNVLITGESGTGKELIARAIHRWSPRNEKSFMTINCSAIPDTLLESELFGFEKGAFTGAQYMKKGLLEQADGGTVFFDEIGDVSPLFQVKILRVLQEGEIMRIGGMRHLKVDVRYIVATNVDLKTACDRGQNVPGGPLLPPERDSHRAAAAPEKAGGYPAPGEPLYRKAQVQGGGKKYHRHCNGCHAGGSELSLPGRCARTRELENSIEYAIAFTAGPEIRKDDLPKYLLEDRKLGQEAQRIPIMPLKDAKGAFEKSLIIAASGVRRQYLRGRADAQCPSAKSAAEDQAARDRPRVDIAGAVIHLTSFQPGQPRATGR